VDNLLQSWPGAHFELADDGASVVITQQGQRVAHWFMGDALSVQASHHDGDKLHFRVAG
jgi:hypothetical protein